MLFGERLVSQVRRFKTPLVVGVDPCLPHLPRCLLDGVAPASHRDAAQAVELFCKGILDVAAELVPAVKPQAAYFELLGPDGWRVLKSVVAEARARGLLVILDGKRNDIGSTAHAYAAAYLSRTSSPMFVDALTVNPYLGEDGLRPFLETARQSDCGVFVLVKTSNPGSGQFQDLQVDGIPIHRRVARLVEDLSCEFGLADGFGTAGAVVGATFPEQLAELRHSMPHCWFLVPGLGAQGGMARDAAAAFLPNGTGAFVNSSRAISHAHERDEYTGRYREADWQRCVEDAIRDTISALATETAAGKL